MKRNFKTQIIFALVLVLVITSFTGCNSKKNTKENSKTSTTRIFKDSVDREVEVPTQIDKVAVSGPLAQIVVFAIAPDKLAGISNAWSDLELMYIDEKYKDLTELGQLYGGKGDLNSETLIDSGAQVVIDVGEPKDDISNDLDKLQEQTGIPFVHISATLDKMDTTYTMLGELLDMKEEGEKLAKYCRNKYDEIVDIANSVDKKDVLYITGESGLNVLAKDSFHAEVIDLLANNVAVVDSPSSKGTGNEVDMEQIYNWDPEVIIFAPDSIALSASDMPDWQKLRAIQSNEYYQVPEGPYNWMGFPPSVQRFLGMMWTAKVLYPKSADYDLAKDIKEYFKLFYHTDLSDSMANDFILDLQ